MVKHAHLLLGRASNNMVTLLHIHTLVLLGENNLTVLVDASKNGIITSNWHVCNSGSVMVKCLLTAAGHCNAVLVPGIWSHACKYIAVCEEFLSCDQVCTGQDAMWCWCWCNVERRLSHWTSLRHTTPVWGGESILEGKNLDKYLLWKFCAQLNINKMVVFTK